MNQEPMTEETKRQKWQRRAKLERLGWAALGLLFGPAFVFLVKPDIEFLFLLIGCANAAVWLAVMGLILWKIKIPMNIKTDEREKMIRTKSYLAGTSAVLIAVLLVGLTTLGICIHHGIDAITLRVQDIGFLVAGTGVLFALVHSVTWWWLRR